MVEIRYKYSVEILNKIYQNKTLIFVEETAINTDLMPIKRYWKKGEKLELIKCDLKTSLTMIAAISNKNPLGIMFFKPNTKSADFLIFLLEII